MTGNPAGQFAEESIRSITNRRINTGEGRGSKLGLLKGNVFFPLLFLAIRVCAIFPSPPTSSAAGGRR